MALIQTIHPSDLYRMACRMNRGDQFGYNGWKVIGDYLDQLSDDLGEDMEVDIIAICCDYSMVESADDFAEQCDDFMDEVDPEAWGDMDEREKLDIVAEYIDDNGSLVFCKEGLIIWQAF